MKARLGSAVYAYDQIDFTLQQKLCQAGGIIAANRNLHMRVALLVFAQHGRQKKPRTAGIDADGQAPGAAVFQFGDALAHAGFQHMDLLQCGKQRLPGFGERKAWLAADKRHAVCFFEILHMLAGALLAYIGACSGFGNALFFGGV